MNRSLELLAPAGGMEALRAAIGCGADAVYLGAARFSARANAENFDDAALRDAAAMCHQAGVKLFLAVNTLLFDDEFPALDALVQTIAEIGADGVIVQDLGVAAYLRTRIPTLRLHASTQLTVHTPAGVRLAKQAGFCRAVLARELSRTQIAAICEAAKAEGMETEVFVHGAQCMCVSGQCFLSAAMGGRSANRGCCAQPCRLAFTADAARRDAAALSLKDMSLVQYLGELAEIGVDSLKIEGRMKRPEYVAAAVTACREALTGGQPDLMRLRAVFSRSGFTDGYYTGARRDMFGTRKKEDVLAANDVLDDLRKMYEKPRKYAVLDAHYTLAPEKPATLTVSDREGHAVTVSGEIPQQAISRETDLPQLQKQFAKLGDTVYEPGTVTAALAPGLMLPASALNALRRQATAAMDAERIAGQTPVHRLGRIPKTHANTRKPSVQIPLRLQIRRLNQLDAIRDLADLPETLLIPLQLLVQYHAAPLLPPERCIILPPRFVCDEAKIAHLLENAYQLGYRQLGCGHPGDLKLGAEMGFTLHGMLGVHLANGFAAEELCRLGLSDALCAPELPVPPASPIPVGCFTYGRLPLMLTRNCPIKAQVGCAKCGHHLLDRKGASVYVDCTRCADSPDYAELFNAAPVWRADKPLSGDFALLAMSDESPARVREVLLAYSGKADTQPPKAFTRGLQIRRDKQ